MRAILYAALLTVTSSLACTAMPGGRNQQKDAPVVQAISPTAASVGASNINLAVSGTNFSKRASLLWNGKRLKSYQSSDGTLRTTLSQSELAAPGTAKVVVENPSGEQSDPAAFTISSPTVNSSTGTNTTTGSSGIAALTISNSSLPQAVTGSAYSAGLIASGGTPAYAWSLQSGSLPGGLALSQTGQISGVPSQSGTFSFTARVMDSSSPANTASKNLSISVAAAPLAITNSTLPSGTVGSAYSATVNTSGGTAPYSFSLTSGSLPSGIGLAANGALSGTPSVSGTFNFSVRVSDAASQTTSKALSISVAATAAPLAITTSSLNSATAGSAYSATVSASGGKAPYSFSLASGPLPPGIALAASGALSGTPTQSGTSTFTVRVADAASQTATRTLSIAVASPAPAPLTITTSSVGSGTVGSAYSATVSASGGTTPYSFSLSSGALPPGVALATSGALSGTPSQSGTFSFTVRATDAASQAATKALSIAVASAPAASGSPYPGTGDTIVFQDDFEGGNLSKWDETPSRYAIESDTRNVHSGRYALRSTLNAGGNWGELNKWYMPGYDEVYAKFQVMFSSGYKDGGMHMATLLGNNVNNKWSASGKSGMRPNGTDFFYAGVDPEYPNGEATGVNPFMFYSYWPGMTCPSGYDAVNNQNCWGNTVVQNTPKIVNTAGVWHEVVVHVKLNAIGQSNGMQELWVDGQKVISQTGMLFRTTTDLRQNQFSWQLYTQNSPQQQQVWMDDLVVWSPSASAPVSGAPEPATASQTFVSAPIIATSSLPPAVLGTGYSTGLSASGGTVPYTWSMPSGVLPSGVVMSATTGQLSGTPTAGGNFGFTAQVTDAEGQTASKSLSLSVQSNPVAVVTGSVPSATVDVPYSTALASSGGMSPYSWTLQSGSLPPGLSLNGGNGTISGKPSSAGTYNFTAQVSDALGQNSSRPLSLAVGVASSGSSASPVFSDNFESGAVKLLSQGGPWYDLYPNTFWPTTSYKHSGSYGVQAYGGPGHTGAYRGAVLEPPYANVSEWWTRTWFYVSPNWTAVSSGGHFQRWTTYNDPNGWLVVLDLSQNSHELRLREEASSTTDLGTGFYFPQHRNEWNCLEVHGKVSSGGNANGTLELYINGNLLAGKNSVRFGTSSSPGLMRRHQYLSNMATNSGDVWSDNNWLVIDDVAWSTARVGCN